MNDVQYRQHCLDALRAFSSTMQERTQALSEGDPLRELVTGFENLVNDPEALFSTGYALVSRLFTTYPELAPLFPRDLLWFMGGDCLHLMADDEIELYQALDDERLAAADEGKVFNIADARARRQQLQ